jgi:hypothetical protein
MTIIESRTLLIARIVVFFGFISGPAFLILSIVNFNQGGPVRVFIAAVLCVLSFFLWRALLRLEQHFRAESVSTTATSSLIDIASSVHRAGSKAKILENKALVHSAPDPAASVLAELPEGTEVALGRTDTDGGMAWVEATAPDGTIGYINGGVHIFRIRDVKLAQNDVDVSEQPAANSKSETYLLRGEKFTLTGVVNEGESKWLRVRSSSGEVGFIPHATRFKEVASFENDYVLENWNPVTPWLTIWTRPRMTVRKLADVGDEGLRVAVLAGVLEGYSQFSLGRFSRGRFSFWNALFELIELRVLFVRNFWPAAAATSAFAGAIGGIMWVWAGAEVFQWVGRLFGGRSTSNEVRTALCWSQVPQLLPSFALLVLSLPINLLYGDARSPGFDQHLRASIYALARQMPYIAIMTIGFCLLVVTVLFSIIVRVASLWEVLALSLWRTLGTIVVAQLLTSLLFVLASRLLQLL